MTINILMGFCHEHPCTNDNPCYFCMGFRHAHLCSNYHPYFYGFSSFTYLYEWLSISLCMGLRHTHFCTNDNPFFLYGFLSYTFLYERLSIFLWVFVMYIFVRMTTHISFCMGFRLAHFCTNDYPYSYGFLSCTSLYEWLSLFF